MISSVWILVVFIILSLIIYIVFYDVESDEKKRKIKIEEIVNYEKEAKELFINFINSLKTRKFHLLENYCNKNIIRTLNLTKKNTPFFLIHSLFIKQNQEEIVGEFISSTYEGEYLKNTVVFSKFPQIKIRSIV